MKKIDRVIADLKEHGSIPINKIGEGVFLHSGFCDEESIKRDFCPSHFGLEECVYCVECELACQDCWNEEINSEHE